MGKIEENKQQKLDALLESAYHLFLTKGIEKTSISDIAREAKVAKGTFYLYFEDKYQIRDKVIAKTAEKLFVAAHTALLETKDLSFEEQIIFLVDYILNEMRQNKALLRFISKNLSYGIFRQAITNNEQDSSPYVLKAYHEMILENKEIRLRAPETMLFLIIELASSASYSTILDEEPMTYEELKPYLDESIRAIIQNHLIRE